jgi:hypothetical protein
VAGLGALFIFHPREKQMDKLIQLMSDVRALRAMILALGSALVTGGGMVIQRGGGTAAGHAAIIVRVSQVAADVDTLKAWRTSASNVQVFLACHAIAVNDGLDPQPCELLCPPAVRKDIRELLTGRAR